jgi:hypothetical protein
LFALVFDFFMVDGGWWMVLLAGSRPGGRLTFLCFAKEK